MLKFKKFILIKITFYGFNDGKRNLKADLKEIVSLVYIKTEKYDFEDIHIKPRPVDFEIDEFREHNVVFDEIKEEIVQGIRNTKYCIWAAVAWFTDQEIFNELLLRKNDGVNEYVRRKL